MPNNRGSYAVLTANFDKAKSQLTLRFIDAEDALTLACESEDRAVEIKNYLERQVNLATSRGIRNVVNSLQGHLNRIEEDTRV